MKYISILLFTLISISGIYTTNAQSNENHERLAVDSIQPITPAVGDVPRILEFLASDSLAGRDTGSEGLRIAADFIISEFKQNGLKPYFDTYLDTFDAKGTETYNVVGFLPGRDPELAKEFVIIGAHYDHIGKGKEVNNDVIANGANDNAAGSTAVITLAKHYANLKVNKRSMLFVLFGAEEKGLLGSKHLSKKLKDQGIDLYAMINFEMIGVPLQDKDYKAYITGFEISNMAEKFNEYTGETLIGFLPKAKEFQLFRRSDNYPFFKEFNVPCQTISTFDFTNYEYYHHVDDEVSQLNFEFMKELINDCIPAIDTIVNTPTKEIKLN